jgi:hypothetical protein
VTLGALDTLRRGIENTRGVRPKGITQRRPTIEEAPAQRGLGEQQHIGVAWGVVSQTLPHDPLESSIRACPEEFL